jgi:hypothetical protein
VPHKPARTQRKASRFGTSFVSPAERRRLRLPPQRLIKIAGTLAGLGVLLFFHVWCPIQAERAAIRLKKIQTEVASKKAELDELKSDYATLTSLSVLDRWARTHGPWRAPSDKDIITIQ